MTATRNIAGTELPVAGTWAIDPGHAEVGFVGRHFGLTRVRGRFTGVEGTVTIADSLPESHVDVTIDVASVSSGYDTRDAHLRSADLFDVQRHPTAQFTSTRLDVEGTRATLTGDLTLAGVTRPVELAVEYLGAATDPWDNERAVFRATGRINRHDWGLTWNMPLAAGGLLVSKEIALELEVELVLQPS